MNIKENNPGDIFEINRIDKSKKRNLDLNDQKKEVHLPKLKKKQPKKSSENYFYDQE